MTVGIPPRKQSLRSARRFMLGRLRLASLRVDAPISPLARIEALRPLWRFVDRDVLIGHQRQAQGTTV